MRVKGWPRDTFSGRGADKAWPFRKAIEIMESPSGLCLWCWVFWRIFSSKRSRRSICSLVDRLRVEICYRPNTNQLSESIGLIFSIRLNLLEAFQPDFVIPRHKVSDFWPMILSSTGRDWLVIQTPRAGLSEPNLQPAHAMLFFWSGSVFYSSWMDLARGRSLLPKERLLLPRWRIDPGRLLLTWKAINMMLKNWIFLVCFLSASCRWVFACFICFWS